MTSANSDDTVELRRGLERRAKFQDMRDAVKAVPPDAEYHEELEDWASDSWD